MKIQITLDFDITENGLENDQVHVVVERFDDDEEESRWAQDWWHQIDVNSPDVGMLLADISEASWILSGANTHLEKAIKKFCRL